MMRSILLATALIVTSIVSSQAHCGTCDHKDKGKSEKKDGNSDDKDDKKSEEKK